MCFEGFYGNGNKQNNWDGRGGAKGCQDIDECATINNCDLNGQNCINTFVLTCARLFLIPGTVFQISFTIGLTVWTEKYSAAHNPYE